MLRVNTDFIELTDDYMYMFEGRPFTGIGYELNDSGGVFSEIQFHNGMQHGVSRSYHKNGHVKHELNYRCNALHGISRMWDETGNLEREETHELGICVQKKTTSLTGQLEVIYELNESDPLFHTLQLLRDSNLDQSPE